ncbi:MAG TPA: CGNR zinc finger domain-containing protein [Gaiellaceae bacterium]|nr:CGNR zinc finger domain-containing protein [Gaiellaceae bacterium]
MPRKPPRYDLPHAAPEPLRIVQSLVNTRDFEYGNEWLGTVAELRAWLSANGLSAHARGLRRADVERIQKVREGMRALLVANNLRVAPERGRTNSLRGLAREASLAVTVREDGRLELVPSAGGIDGAIAEILAAALVAVIEGTWPRLKACPNCHWAFYDRSKNRSASWCSMALCGNRLKTKNYRQRRKRSQAATRSK